MRGLLCGLLALCAAALRAQEPDTTELAELRRQIEAITRELEALRLGGDVVVRADTAQYGFGPAASKVYRTGQGVSIGGYGEVLYENFAASREDGRPSGRVDQLDALRAIVYLGYKFDERLLFNSEIEFEHANTGAAGEVELEFAYLDYRLSPHAGVRAGLLLMPMGILNEQHEPPTFVSARRTDVENQLIPSTWRENGIGVFGQAGDFAYRAYVVNGFDGVGGGTSAAGGFAASGLRGGRQGGSRALAEDLAAVARVEYTTAVGLALGASGYFGQSGQNRPDPGDPTRTIGAETAIWEVHGTYRAYGFDLRALYAQATVDDAELINQARGLAGTASVGERLVGWYVQAGYDVLRAARTGHQLLPYVRYERLNTQHAVPAGYAANPANDQRVVAFGASWKPITQAALKIDYQIRSNRADTGVNQWNVAVAYLF